MGNTPDRADAALVDQHVAARDFNDLVAQYMTDEECYEVECLPTEQAIERFIDVFGATRWAEICKA